MKRDLQGFFRKVASKAVDQVKSVDTDKGLMLAMAAGIETARARHKWDAAPTWSPGEPLRLLLAGYTGSRNTGADVRVEAMIRQFRFLFGDDHLELSILTNDPKLTRGYFRTVEQLELPKIFPKFMVQTIREQHGVIACEGSMFKSKFANALSTMMVGALGTAAAEHKLAIAYGGEAGGMDNALESLVSRYCKDAQVIARNANSVEVLGNLGITAELGTDTAWTFEPAAPSVGEAILKEHGWNGVSDVLVLCPINAFWWPVRPDLQKGALHALTGAHERDHYASVYFHHGGAEVDRKQAQYIAGLADGAAAFMAGRDVFVAAVGMEQLDRSACQALVDRLGGGAVIVSDTYDQYEMVSVIRRATWMVSSRYHALVTSMPGGVLSVGVTMDERIPNLMADRGQSELALRVDDPNLADAVNQALRQVDSHAAEIRLGIERTTVDCIEMMGWMGARLVQMVRAAHPEFPFRDGLGDTNQPWAHLPPLSPDLAALVDRHRKTA
ncbi:MAG: polysaccharide pyruvyl transferase WcaK-like protein [Myxococcota bacterium]|jgi:polysaccharide pyruvyl transferase WcaK-like protein